MTKISEIMLLQRPEQPILAIEAKTDMNGLSKLIGKSFGEIGAYLAELGEVTTDIPFVAYPDYEGMSEQNISVMIGFKVSRPLPAKDDIKSIMLPAKKIILCMHQGTYEELADLYMEMTKWGEAKNYIVEGTSFEYYYTGPDVPESEHVTRVEMPLKE